MTAPKNAAINGSRTSPLQGAMSVRYATPIPKTIRADNDQQDGSSRSFIRHRSAPFLLQVIQFDGEHQLLRG